MQSNKKRLIKSFILFIFLINSIKCQNLIIEQQPIFTNQPIDVEPLFSGSRGILQCTASGTPAVSYRWLRNGQFITQKSSSGTYLISNADRFTDVGVYQCVAENTLGAVLSNKALLNVAYMDQLKTTYSTDVTVRQQRAAIIKLPKIFDAYPQPTIEWFTGGALIEPNAKFAITKEYDLVVLRADKKTDEKAYYVEVSSIHTGTKIRSKDIHLSVFDSNFENSFTDEDTDLEFVVKPVDTVAKLNDNLVKFDCIVNSRQTPLDQLEIQWYKDNQLIDFIKTKYHLSARSLEIISVTDQDAGVYTCSVKHNLDTKPNYLNASARLDVYIKPTFKIQPESVIETDYGKTVQLKCEGIANPLSNITWYKNAQLIDFTKQTNIQLNESNTRLIINNISKNDQAIYQCFLSNEAGQISASSLIKIISFTPKFTEAIRNKTIYSDSNAYLSCGKVDGSPRPKITWIKLNEDGPYLIGSNSRDNELNTNVNKYSDELNDYLGLTSANGYFVNQMGDLIIRNVNSRNQGWFKCEAQNLLGSISGNMYLQVKRKTEIIEPPMNISVTKGQSALFKCTVSKEDDVDIDLKWTFNDLPLDLQFNSNLILYSNGTLQILEAKNTDIGIYKCLVKSISNEQAGSDSKTAYLNVVELPYAPYAVQAELNKIEKRSVNLTWQAAFDGNSQILKYIVQARITTPFDLLMLQQQQNTLMSSNSYQNSDWQVVKDNIYETRPSFFYLNQQQQHIHWTIITNLNPALSYEFRVSAVNGIGEGMPSRPSNNITIPEEEPSEAPQGLQADLIESKSISLKWQWPVLSTWNGRLKGYRIAYSLSYPNSTWKYVEVNDPLQMNANLTDLIVWEIYLIKICAFNSKGPGRFSDPPIRVRTKEGIPIRAPLNFRANAFNSTCIKMAWSEPPAQFVNGIIQGYKLIYYKDNQSDSKNIHIININSLKTINQLDYQQENQHNYDLCDLSKFTMYTFSILCFTNSGDGPTTQPIQLQTLEDVPGEISDISFANVYDTSIDIEWKPPNQPNGRILSYIISYKSKVNPKFEHVVLDASQNSYTLKNLKQTTLYEIGIRAKTQAGEGQIKLTQIQSGVPPELPEPPQAIILGTIGSSFVELNFIAGSTGKTSISKWIVEALVVLNTDDYNTYMQSLVSNSDKSYLKWTRVYETNAPNATRIKVTNLKPFTNYTLRMYAQNIKGISKPSVQTQLFQTLADVPSVTPSYLGARLLGLYSNTSKDSNINVLLKWSPIPTSKWNGIPLGYVVSVEECGLSPHYKNEIKLNSKNEYELKGLKANECYQIRICAWNSVGLGPWTSDSNILVLNRTSEAKPFNGPRFVNLYSVNSTTMKVIWSKLDEKQTNGILIGYKLKYTPDLGENNYLLSQSHQNNFYSDEDTSNEILSPDYYSNKLKSKYLFIKLNHKISNQLFYEDNSDLTEIIYLDSFKNVNNSYEMIYLNDLISFTNYKIEIAGCTRAGCGVYSSPVSLRTSENRPSKPINLNFPFVNLTSVQLEWSNPLYQNGILKSYRIRYMLNPQVQQNSLNEQWSVLNFTWNQTTNTKHSQIINDLLKTQYYLFEISASNTNGMGWGEPAYSLVYMIDTQRRNRPDTPSQPSVSKSSIKPNELTLSFSLGPNNYSPIRYVTIQMKEINQSNWFTIVDKYFVDAQAKSELLTIRIGGKYSNGTNLIKSNGHALKFRVSATNDVGSSDFSLESDEIRTKFTYPKHKLANLRVNAVNLNKINLSWYEHQNDYLTKFKIVYKLVMLASVLNQDIAESVEFIIDYKSTFKTNFSNTTTIKHEFELDNLIFLPNGTYEIKVCGINQVGEGECAYSHLVYMEDRLPYLNESLVKSVNALSSTELNVTWSQPSLDCINGKLYAYKIVYYKNDDLTDQSEIIVEPELTNTIINNLRPFTKYSVYIQLINQAGESPLKLTNLKSAKTFESIPMSPERLIFSYVAYTYLNLTFIRPKQPNGDIQSYEIWYENLPRQTSPSNEFKTKIIRQEIKTNAPNYTLYINNLEANTDYKFKVRCRTSIDWGAYTESVVRTGPQIKKSSTTRGNLIDEMDDLYSMGSPLPPGRPMYIDLNTTHALLEWKASSDNYEFFIIEIKYLFIQPQSQPDDSFILLDKTIQTSTFNYIKNTNASLANNFELFAYSNRTSLLITKSILNNSPLFLFRVYALNFIGISESSPDSEIIHNRDLKSSKQDNSLFINSKQTIYSNWWFLVIVALASMTLLIICILIMCLRGKNQKFLLNKKKKRMNTMRMNSMQKSSLKNGSTATNIHLIQTNASNERKQQIHDTNILLENLTSSDSNDFSQDNLGYNSTLPTSSHIYLTNTNPNLVINNNNSLSKNALYELRKSKRGGAPALPQTGTLRTATYVSPNGTLSKVNIITTNSNDNAAFSSSLNEEDNAAQTNTLGKINPRNLNSILNGFFAHNAQPNDYCSSGAIGALIKNNKQIGANNHYLQPTSNQDVILDDQIDAKPPQFYYGQQNYSSMHLPRRNPNESVLRSVVEPSLPTQTAVQNFYTIEDDSAMQQLQTNSVLYDRNATNNLSNRKVFTTSSFGTTKTTNTFEDRRANSQLNYQSYRPSKQMCMNTYYEHQQVYQLRDKQPTYHTHLGIELPIQNLTNNNNIINTNESFPSPPPVVVTAQPISPTQIQSSKPPPPPPPQPAPPVPPPPPPPPPMTRLQQTPEHISTPINLNKNSSSISISLNTGDRVVMNNTAGSRKPLTGFSFV